MKVLFKLWIYTEVCKLLIILLSLSIENNNTWAILFALVLAGLTVISFSKALPELKKLTNFILIEEDLENRAFLCKSKNILIATLILDLLPMFPIIQAIFKYYYYKLDRSIDKVIKKISLRLIDIY